MGETDPSITAHWQADFRKQVADLRAMTAEQITAVGKRRSPTWHEDEFPAWTASKTQVDPEIRLYDPEPWQDYVARITAPTLLIYGEPGFGSIVTPDIAKAAQDLNPQIETAQLAGAGHNTRRENFEAYLAAVVSFLAKIWPLLWLYQLSLDRFAPPVSARTFYDRVCGIALLHVC